MKRSYFILRMSLFALIVAISTGCNKDASDETPGEPVDIDLSADQIAVVSSGNGFSFDLFRHIENSAQAGQNVLLSPLSVSTALSMTMNGAAGPTLDSMKKALRLGGLDNVSINNAYHGLSENLLTVDKRVAINLANSVWIEKNLTVKKPFITVLTEAYTADVKSFDVTDINAPDLVNSWIEGKTNGLIKNMIDQLDPNTVMMLINAIYFKGKWRDSFDKTSTINQKFYKYDGSSSDVPMMKQKSEFKAYTADNFSMVEFPYGQGNFVMDVILPAERTGLNNIIPLLTGENFSDWTGKMSTRKVDVTFPRFKYGFKLELKDILSAMGMGLAFSDFADFSNIADLDLLITSVLHQAFIETNEEGTEAAAATVVTIGVTSAGPSSELVFNMDHPFLYLIRETSTNTILFMGKLEDPHQN